MGQYLRATIPGMAVRLSGLAEACRILTAARHCDAEWCIACNGLGPHAWGVTPGRKPNIAMPADDAVRLATQLEMAGELFREFRASCFWQSPPDLTITAELVPFVVRGLRAHGGRRGFRLASLLRSMDSPPCDTRPSSLSPCSRPGRRR